jgi:hypothetical protein
MIKLPMKSLDHRQIALTKPQLGSLRQQVLSIEESDAFTDLTQILISIKQLPKSSLNTNND